MSLRLKIMLFSFGSLKGFSKRLLNVPPVLLSAKSSRPSNSKSESTAGLSQELEEEVASPAMMLLPQWTQAALQILTRTNSGNRIRCLNTLV